MPLPKTKQEVIEKFLNNSDYKTMARRVMDEEWFQSWLDAVFAGLGPFSAEAKFDERPHIQDRKDGGKSAINLFLHRLTTLPYTEGVREPVSDEYIGFDTSSAIQTASNRINRS